MDPFLEPLFELIARYPVWAAGAGLLILALILRAAGSRSEVNKDPVRLYTTAERSSRFAQAGGRCEMDGWIPFLRCRRPAAHGDHFIPWAKGGATSMKNFVSACARCNMSKGAKSPTWAAARRIAWRRRSFFPRGEDRTPGEVYRG